MLKSLTRKNQNKILIIFNNYQYKTDWETIYVSIESKKKTSYIHTKSLMSALIFNNSYNTLKDHISLSDKAPDSSFAIIFQ